MDWSDLLFLFPVTLLTFLLSSHWIRHLDPTAQTLSPENLSVLNFNLMLLFGSSGIVFVLWKIWVRGSIFNDGWKTGLSPYQILKIKLLFLGGLAIYVAFMLTRNI